MNEVDTTDPDGTSTLFAARNTSLAPLDLEIEYFGPSATSLRREDLETLDARETLTVNVRNVAGLDVDPDGFTRGFIRIRTTPPNIVLTGDFLQVDVGNNFATGDRLVAAADFCARHEVRFLDFGDGTSLQALINVPQGTDPAVDPPSIVVSVVGEDGAAFASTDVYTDQNTLPLAASDFTGLGFGTLIFDFTSSGGGWVYAAYSAFERFSVGLNSACVMP